VRIISERPIKEFRKKFSDSEASLLAWVRIVRAAEWSSFADVRATFANADQIRERVVFNIARNRYRLIAFIHYRAGVVYVKAILTHTEYDKGDWKE
jgi:mRNA interferase HigB